MRVLHFSILFVLLTCLSHAGPLERGLKAKSSGDFGNAVRELALAVRDDPKNAEAWFHYGTVLGWEKRYEEAAAALDKGLELAPADFDMRMARARVMAWKGDYDKAEDAFGKLAIEYPESDDVRVMQGRVATWKGDKKQAKIHYETVLARNPNQVDALTGMGDLAMDQQDKSGALGFYQRAFSIDPTPDVQQRITRVEEFRYRRFDAGVTGSSFVNEGRSDWWSFYAQYSHLTAYGNLWGRIEHGERFNELDTTLEVGWEDRLNDVVRLRVLGGFTPDAFWAPEWYLEADTEWNIPNLEPALLAEIRYAEYAPRGVFTSRLGPLWSFGEGWTASLRWVYQDFESGRPTNGWIAALEKQQDSGWIWRAGLASGAETLDGQALNFANRVLESKTYFAGVRGMVNENWGWRVDLEYEDYDTGPNRRGISVGFHHSF